MPKPILLFLFLLCLFSCNRPHETFGIRGYIENAADEDTIMIVRFTGAPVLEEVAHCTVKGRKFTMQGTAGHPGPLYLRYKADDGYRHSMFFMEEGELEIVIDTSGCRVTGTLLNDLRNSIEDTLNSHLVRLCDIERLYYSTELDAEQLARLSACGLNLQEMLVSYFHTVVKENIHNPIGLYLLVVYNQIFTTEELDTFINQIPNSLIVGSNIPFYKRVTNIVEERKNARIE